MKDSRVSLGALGGPTAPLFTPGPWKWWTSNSWRRLKRDNRGITQNVLEPFVARDGHPDLTVSEADMALIAAAPEMFEALTLAEELHQIGIVAAPAGLYDRVHAARKAAIAKAEGRS